MKAIEKIKEYLEHKAKLAIEFTPVSSRIIEAKGMTSPSNKRSKFFKFFTKSHHKYTSLYKRMYVDGTKRITSFVLNKLNAEILAYLFMDDGCNEKVHGKTKSYKICLGNFPIEDVINLKNTLFNKFQISSKIYLEKRKYPIIRIGRKEDKLKFESLLKPFIVPCMQYKIIYT